MIEEIIELRDMQARRIMNTTSPPEEREAASQWLALSEETKYWATQRDVQEIFSIVKRDR